MSAPAPFDVDAWFLGLIELLERKARRKIRKARRWKERRPEAADAAERTVEFTVHQLDRARVAHSAFERLARAVGSLPLTNTPYGLLVREEDFDAVRQALFHVNGEEAPAPLSDSLAASPAACELAPVSVGRLPTMNQSEYPGLGDWWVQLRIGPDRDVILARVFGDSPDQAKERAIAVASALNARAVHHD
ncbi:hypothetical protein LVB77_14745 [Lysobacter sp. 5GHs7-4]|uniref:hypothetical protein n=1 Tax=Lysobacter sp. 5GHs7-4 TaxID=2904253 RepID=UPI001E305502|nr:hypothetical protein [Lysobacter sp. 5GHs7-4]UHQ21924.1 hypothetical protein LVB77_14745 [Lysobacter sp. 5GHs7-4]